MDWFRRQKVRRAVMTNMSDFETDEGEDFDLLEVLASRNEGQSQRIGLRPGFQGTNIASNRTGD